jgi:hypothetical protein
MNRRDMLAVLGFGGLITTAGAASATSDDKSPAKKDAQPDWSKFPKVTGKVKHMLEGSFGYITPEVGDPFHLDLRDIPNLTSLEFNPKTKSYIHLSGPVEVESIYYSTNGAFDHMRLISKSKDPVHADHIVAIDIRPAPGRGRGSNYVLVWVVIQSQGVMHGVALIEGEYEGKFPDRVK